MGELWCDLGVKCMDENEWVIWVVYMKVRIGIKIYILLCYFKWNNKDMRIECLFYFLNKWIFGFELILKLIKLKYIWFMICLYINWVMYVNIGEKVREMYI